MNFNNRFAGSVYLRCILSLLLVAGSFYLFAAPQKQKAKKKSVEYKLTVAGISPSRENAKYMEVIFLESTRYYKISNKSKKYIAILTEGQKSQKPVWVKRANEYSDVILRVRNADDQQ